MATIGWVEEIVAAMTALGGKAKYKDLYGYIEANTERKLGKEWQAVVRRTIEEHSSDTTCKKSPNYADLFTAVKGIGKGEWALRHSGKTANSRSLQVVKDTDEVDSLEAIFKARFRLGTKVYERSLGNPGADHGPYKLYWNSRLSIWGVFEEGESRFWNPFGTDLFPESQSGAMTVQINPSRVGHSNTEGAFLRDAVSGRTFLAHRGGLGGTYSSVSHEFFDHYRGPIAQVIDGNKAERFAVVTALDDPELQERVAAFVYEVARIKLLLGPSPNGAFGNYSPLEKPEFSGVKRGYEREGYVEATCLHGTVVNTLLQRLNHHKLNASRDQLRDAYFPRTGACSVIFEVKTNTDPYSIYTGVGQLMIHGRAKSDNVALVMLTPPLPKQLQNDLARLGVHSIHYTINGQNVSIEGLGSLLTSLQ